jgi:hypothetical protein
VEWQHIWHAAIHTHATVEPRKRRRILARLFDHGLLANAFRATLADSAANTDATSLKVHAKLGVRHIICIAKFPYGDEAIRTVRCQTVVCEGAFCSLCARGRTCGHSVKPSRNHDERFRRSFANENERAEGSGRIHGAVIERRGGYAALHLCAHGSFVRTRVNDDVAEPCSILARERTRFRAQQVGCELEFHLDRRLAARESYCQSSDDTK